MLLAVVVCAFGALLGFFLSLVLRRAVHFENELRAIMWRDFEAWLRENEARSAKEG